MVHTAILRFDLNVREGLAALRPAIGSLVEGRRRVRRALTATRIDGWLLPIMTVADRSRRSRDTERKGRALDRISARRNRQSRPFACKKRIGVTQMHYARQGIITPEMEFIAIREKHSPRLSDNLSLSNNARDSLFINIAAIFRRCHS